MVVHRHRYVIPCEHCVVHAVPEEARPVVHRHHHLLNRARYSVVIGNILHGLSLLCHGILPSGTGPGHGSGICRPLPAMQPTSCRFAFCGMPSFIRVKHGSIILPQRAFVKRLSCVFYRGARLFFCPEICYNHQKSSARKGETTHGQPAVLHHRAHLQFRH